MGHVASQVDELKVSQHYALLNRILCLQLEEVNAVTNQWEHAYYLSVHAQMSSTIGNIIDNDIKKK